MMILLLQRKGGGSEMIRENKMKRVERPYLTRRKKTLKRDIRKGNLSPKTFVDGSIKELSDLAVELNKTECEFQSNETENFPKKNPLADMMFVYSEMLDFFRIERGYNTSEAWARAELIRASEKGYKGESDGDKEIARIYSEFGNGGDKFDCLEDCVLFIERALGLKRTKKGKISKRKKRVKPNEDVLKMNAFYVSLVRQINGFSRGVNEKVRKAEEKRRKAFESACISYKELSLDVLKVRFFDNGYESDESDRVRGRGEAMLDCQTGVGDKLKRLKALEDRLRDIYFSFKGDVNENQSFLDVLKNYQQVYDTLTKTGLFKNDSLNGHVRDPRGLFSSQLEKETPFSLYFIDPDLQGEEYVKGQITGKQKC